jgi:hypothetical protein
MTFLTPTSVSMSFMRLVYSGGMYLPLTLNTQIVY